jgi:hypothetical protein
MLCDGHPIEPRSMGASLGVRPGDRQGPADAGAERVTCLVSPTTLAAREPPGPTR